ncbi:prolyl oligopeptidase family serine peptidase [Paraflavitalea sp. CAU 1676]|uniref:S9 family peptidase n=1 Tax=Paraflavitalea sp. CAU 1676 TaxID=3032598 RepID=UPI0023D9DD2C|nr:prolyl oligopeptidase family serine peptidase [Paraflavitalea sp. CAU 1676]MDF2189682.1 prolyl oligopeptidase family serine peptidase [Paraflavitalea sp. CAU 1676]
MQKNGALLLFLLFIGNALVAQTITRFQPGHAELVQRYLRAARIDSATKNAVFKTTVSLNWFAGEKLAWYCNVLQDSIQEYILVDATKGKKQPLFNRSRLAAGLQQIGIVIDSLRPGLSPYEIQPARSMLKFKCQGQYIECNLNSYVCISTQQSAPSAKTADTRRFQGRGAFPQGSTSPDKKWEAYLEKGNLFVKPAPGGAGIQLTTDGTPDKPYGSIYWSPDSKYLAGYHINMVRDSSVFYVLTSLPNTFRGTLRSQSYKQPGDPWTIYTPFVFYPAEQKVMKVKADAIDFLNAPEPHWRGNDARYFTYEKMDRGHQRFRIMEVDAADASARTVVDEQTNTFIYNSRNFTYYLPRANQLIRTSEKAGWNHLYLVDIISGQERPITTGQWVVRGVDSIDEAKKVVWFRASGMTAGEDPYNIHYYRIGFDGKNLQALTPAAGNHTLVLSPDKTWFTDTWSLVNVAPRTILARTTDAKEIMLLEEADLTVYRKAGVSPPEVFVAKARDGVTDIWGIVSKPSDYDPSKKYPVLENIYAGPHDAFVPKNFTPYSEMQSLAELGFIVVMIDGMGTANRSKAFHDVCWKNLADAGLPDRIGWIKALAQKYAWVDAERVGIYGTSAGGQSSTGALLFHPEFYKAAVSACGCHDNRVDKQWWNEQWMGYPVGMHYEQQSNVTNASKLQGNLLLIVGEADTNVPPESTYRVADALIKAGKNFDLLSIPGMGHSDGGVYGRMRKRDFFVKHLMGVEPPARNAGEIPALAEVGRERWSFQ